MDERDLIEDIGALRDRWREARGRKLSRKQELVSLGKDIASVRHDRLYRDFLKEQRGLTRRIRHLEKTLNRKRARHENKG
jgi:hypothetical protein